MAQKEIFIQPDPSKHERKPAEAVPLSMHVLRDLRRKMPRPPRRDTKK